ncbi:transcriptional regulator [Microtetraspora sp. NBRC 13810]|uniref:helix-turn-helix domain-containing protein n=1 Tax=Microtetraspora sp. NBRC 13810 TaxID=3030990 RepID=UPI0024A1A022|nr:helix-turn-helix transcriptional regulator [Microtetraspora sp. NBRC 13810]GLW12303.1 transcriptional regulator [Microtetraspora sp. NBRC 13810]
MSSAERIKEARGILAARLREIRSEASLTGRELAKRAGWHYSKISKIENGTQMPSEADIREWCRICGNDSYVVDLIANARNIDSLYTEWRRLQENGLAYVQRSFKPLYERTQHFRIFQHSAVPGLLQTPEYARAHLSVIIDFRGLPDDLDSAVTGRLEQQNVLTSGARRFMFLLGNQALRTRLCAPAAMVVQLNRLIDLMRLPQISLGIVPWHVRPPIMPPENFWIYDSNQVRVDTIPGQLRINAPNDVALYEKAFGRLAEAAVYGDAALQRIDTAIRELDSL